MDVKEEPKEEIDYDEYADYPGIKTEPEDRKPMGLVGGEEGGYDDDDY